MFAQRRTLEDRRKVSSRYQLVPPPTQLKQMIETITRARKLTATRRRAGRVARDYVTDSAQAKRDPCDVDFSCKVPPPNHWHSAGGTRDDLTMAF
jgi:hypothetical protein